MEDINDISEELEEESWAVFERFNRDKKWSFIDCTGKVVMDLLRIEEVFTFDYHFEQMPMCLYNGKV